MEKKRCNNFSNDEVEVLVGLVELSKGIVVCGTGRTAKMLRSKWDSLKKCIKKEYAEQKQTLYKTGGGPAVEIKLSSVGNRVLAVIGIGATGTVSRYDCDFVEEIPNTESEEVINTIIPLEIIEVPENSWNSWNPTQLRQPISKVLQLPKPSTSATSLYLCIIKTFQKCKRNVCYR
ncbi:hypothetical protein RI129_005647 [Pyrocoelia pectoralis]|uniref:Regulatory protein zeste n=1 Tax=Pyrocoelia pectoralis TaxID=417401 RepID=A0AAN7ZJ48_9COLE